MSQTYNQLLSSIILFYYCIIPEREKVFLSERVEPQTVPMFCPDEEMQFNTENETSLTKYEATYFLHFLFGQINRIHDSYSIQINPDLPWEQSARIFRDPRHIPRSSDKSHLRSLRQS